MEQTLGLRRSNRWLGSLLLVVILTVAGALRLRDLDRTSLWYDEAVSWSQSKGTFWELLTSVAADNYPPLHNALLWLSMPVFGDTETALRLPSALLGIIAVWLIYRVGRTISGSPAGLLSAALLAVSPFHIWYSTEARMYALLAACGLAFLLSVLEVLKNPARKWIFALGITGTVFLYSHIYALLGFASVGLYCAFAALADYRRAVNFRRSSAVIACLAMGASTLAFCPWLIILARRAGSVAEAGFWIAYPDLPFLKNMAFSIAGSHVFFAVLLLLALTGMITAELSRADCATGGSNHKQAMRVCSAYTFGPPLLAYLYSLLVQPILFDRYLIAAWPGLLLIASTTAQRFLPRVALPILFLAGFALIFPQLKFALSQKVRPEWREIVTHYNNLKSSGDHLILFKGFAAPALRYYLRDTGDFETADSVGDLAKKARSATTGNLWLLIAHSNSDEERAARSAVSTQKTELAAQQFGWGASGLKLVKKIGTD